MNNKKPDSPKNDHNKDDDKRREQMMRSMRFVLGYLVLGLIFVWLFQQFVLTPLQTQAQ